MELMHQWEEALVFVVEFLRIALEIIAALCVFTGLIKVVARVVSIYRRRILLSIAQIRLDFGRWLALALEFQLGSDVISTTIAPSYADLGKLAVVAVIRTFLNYFLAQELEKEEEHQRKRRQKHQQKHKSVIQTAENES